MSKQATGLFFTSRGHEVQTGALGWEEVEPSIKRIKIKYKRSTICKKGIFAQECAFMWRKCKHRKGRWPVCLRKLQVKLSDQFNLWLKFISCGWNFHPQLGFSPGGGKTTKQNLVLIKYFLFQLVLCELKTHLKSMHDRLRPLCSVASDLFMTFMIFLLLFPHNRLSTMKRVSKSQMAQFRNCVSVINCNNTSHTV